LHRRLQGAARRSGKPQCARPLVRLACRRAALSHAFSAQAASVFPRRTTRRCAFSGIIARTSRSHPLHPHHVPPVIVSRDTQDQAGRPSGKRAEVCHLLGDYRNTAINLDLHFCGTAAETSAQLVHVLGPISHVVSSSLAQQLRRLAMLAAMRTRSRAVKWW
jgi:hypothetical protein